MTTATLLLEDGTQLTGTSFGADGTTMGELVFNTGMTGYQEILTDPSYAGQVVVMTYPLIGNYGVNRQDVESGKIQAEGFVVKEYDDAHRHWKGTIPLPEYLKEQGVVALAGVDTRLLTKKIRMRGVMNCLMTTEPLTEAHHQQLATYQFPRDVAQTVSRKDVEHISGPGRKVALIDLGVKQSIVRQLTDIGCDVRVYPWHVNGQTLMDDGCDAVLVSNGPGDPKDATVAIDIVKYLIGKKPVYGICLGVQILALAMGGNTYKMPFGHRGSNHSVLNLENNQVMITAQNHGYAVDSQSLPKGLVVTHINVNDDTVEGIACPERQVRAVQFHPEAGPGPRDARPIFMEWFGQPVPS